MKKPKKPPVKLNNFEIKEIDFKTQKVVSFTQFSMFEQCPHKWANQYVRKLIKTPPSINMTFGTTIHQTIQQWLWIMYNETGAAADRFDMIGFFEEKLIENYKKDMVNGEHFSTLWEINEFREDGKVMLDWIRKKRRTYFTTKDVYLLGIEMPIQKELKPGVIFTGSIDFVIYDNRDGKIFIYDIKTSTKGWNQWNKKDFKKTSQILLYKQYFSELYDFPIDRIEVEFFIVKRKAEPNEFQEFPKYVQVFRPISGKIKMKEAQDKLRIFLDTGFDDNGKIVEKEYEKRPSKLCDYCPFNNTQNCIK